MSQSVDPSGGAALGDDALAEDVALLHRLCDEARRIALGYFRSDRLGTENKAGASAFDPVTIADREIEAALRAILAAARPEDGVLGEEFGPLESRSGRLWVIDPIDGTRSFMAGLLNWGVLIALCDQRGESGGPARSLLGAIDQPYVGERFIGVAPKSMGVAPKSMGVAPKSMGVAPKSMGVAPESMGAAQEGTGWARLHRGAQTRALRTRPCARLAEATLFTTDPGLFEPGPEREAFERLRAAVRLTRYGTDCYGYAMVAAGQADIVLEAGLSAYDLQALIPVVEGAGGLFADWRGAPRPWAGQALALGDASLFEETRALLAG